MKSTLGVLIPYYNEKELLRECLESVLSQPEGPDEILVYDDASEAPAEEYVPTGCPIKIIRGDVNRGPSYGSNVLLQSSQSDYIHFHDADDLFHAQWCRRVREAIEKTGADLILTEVSSFRGSEMECERVLGLERLVSGGDLVRFCLQGGVLPIGSTIRRKAAIEAGGYTESLRHSQEYYYHARLASRGVSYTVIDEPLVFKRNRPYSNSHDMVGVWTCGVDALRLLATEVPSGYERDLAEAAGRAGSMLFKLGDREEARKAFQLANEFGPPSFSEQRRLYRILARAFGPEAAESAGMVYRSMIPARVRGYLAQRGI